MDAKYLQQHQRLLYPPQAPGMTELSREELKRLRSYAVGNAGVDLPEWLGRVPEELRFRKLSVCDHCFRSSCWMGVFMCDDSYEAGLKEVTVWDVLHYQLEHPSYLPDQLGDLKECPTALPWESEEDLRYRLSGERELH